MSVGYYKVDLSYTGYNLDGTIALYGDAARVDLRDQPRQPLGNPEAPFRQGQQHHIAVRGEATAVEGGCDFLPSDGWKAEARDRIVDHGERGRG